MAIDRGRSINKSPAARKTTVNLFVEGQVLDELKDDSSSRGLSLNANINRILMKYVRFHRRVEDLQCVHITGNDFKFFLDNVDENKMLNNIVQNLTDLIPTYYLKCCI